MKRIEMTIDCPSCKGTGVYKGFAEGEGVGVVCSVCNGSGAYLYSYSYNDFTGRKIRKDIQRVYLQSSGYALGLGKVQFEGIGEIDMDKEGVSYSEFLNDLLPKHITKLYCPLRADQSACHKLSGFVDKCIELNGKWIGIITTCKLYPGRSCWERFFKAQKEASQ